MSQFTPDGSSLEQRQSFQTELLELIMDIIHMLSHEEENNTHLNSQGRITMHASLIAPNGLTNNNKSSHLNVVLFILSLRLQESDS